MALTKEEILQLMFLPGLSTKETASSVSGRGVGMGKDHTIFSLISGTVKFSTKRKTHFDNTVMTKKVVSVV